MHSSRTKEISESWWLRLLTALAKDIVQFSAPMSGDPSSSISIIVQCPLQITPLSCITPHEQIFILTTKHKKSFKYKATCPCVSFFFLYGFCKVKQVSLEESWPATSRLSWPASLRPPASSMQRSGQLRRAIQISQSLLGLGVRWWSCQFFVCSGPLQALGSWHCFESRNAVILPCQDKDVIQLLCDRD